MLSPREGAAEAGRERGYSCTPSVPPRIACSGAVVHSHVALRVHGLSVEPGCPRSSVGVPSPRWSGGEELSWHPPRHGCCKPSHVSAPPKLRWGHRGSCGGRSSCSPLETLPTPELLLTWHVGLCKLSETSRGFKKREQGIGLWPFLNIGNKK